MTTYYVDCNVAGPGSGTFGDPWDDIHSNINSLSPGDILCVRGDSPGTRSHDDGAEIDITADGSAGNVITIKPYGSENVCLTRSAQHRLFDINADYITVEGFEMDGNDQWIYMVEVSGHHFTLDDCEIHNDKVHAIVVDEDITYTTIQDCTIYDFEQNDDAHGVMVQSRANYTVIDGCTFHDCSGDSVQFHDSDSGEANAAQYCEITNCTCYRGTVARAEQGIDFKQGVNITCTGNTIYDFGSDPSDTVGDGIVVQKNNCDTILIADNVIYNCKRGIRLSDGTPDNVTIRDNLLYDIEDEGIAVYGADDLDILNNTVVNTGEECLDVKVSGWDGGAFQNNLFYDCTGDATLGEGITFNNVTVDHNGWFATGADAEFEDAGTDTTGAGDPGFVNAAGDDYRLASGSDAIDAGTDVGLAYYGSAPDLGYYEYPPGFTLDAKVVIGQSDTLTIDATVEAAQSAGINAGATLKAAQTGTLNADAAIEHSATGTVTLDATVKAAGVTGSLNADVVVKAAQSRSLTADGMILRGGLAQLTFDATILRARTGTFTIDSRVQPSTVSDTFTADTVVLRERSGSATADAVLLRARTGTLAGDATVRAPLTDTVLLDAAILRAQSGSANADAVVKVARSGSATLDAVVKGPRYESLIPTAAAIRATQTGSLTADAVVLRHRTATLAASATTKASATGALSARAIVLRNRTGTLTASAIIERNPTGTLTLDAYVYAEVLSDGPPFHALPELIPVIERAKEL